MSEPLIHKILSHEASDKEKEAFQKWLLESSDHQDYFEQVLEIWKHSRNKSSLINFDTEKARQRIVQKVPRNRIRKYRNVLLPLAASLLIVIGLSLFLRMHNSFQEGQQYTAGHSIETIVLDDGTRVWLNGGSSLTVDKNYLKRNRKVSLVGEAYFEVSHDIERPFLVRTGSTTTKVLGTRFNLKIDSITQNVDLDLLAGKVAFYKANKSKQKVILVAGEQAVYYAKEKLVQKLVKPDVNYLSWKTKVLRFNETSLQQICNDLNTCYNVSVTTNIDDPELVLTGIFRSEPLENILSTLEISLDVKVHQNASGYLISKN